MKKQQARNKLTRITIALLLILSMLGNTLILPGVAQESAVSADSMIANNGEIANDLGVNASGLDSGNASLSEADEDLIPLEEDESLRDAFTKHYIDLDGTRHAIIFPEQVHYFDGDEWVDIDNTLTYDSNSKKYISNNRKFVTKFSDNALSDQLVSITDGDYTLSWSVSFTNKTQITGSSATRSMTATEEASATISSSAGTLLKYKSSDNEIKHRGNISDMGKVISGVRYDKVFNNSVDLRYSVLHGKIEEDIILNSPDNFTSYILTVNTNGLTALKQADNSIEFINGQGETVFKLAAPWMKDSRVAVSDNIDVTVVQKGTYAYIKYTPDAQWLNDESRAYPVLIDPSFTTRFYTNNYEDTYVYEGDSTSTTRPTETLMPIGNINGNTYYAYIKILNIPDLLDARTIENATFTFWTSASDLPGLDVSVVTDVWSPTTITYATQPSSFRIASNIYGSPSALGDAHYVDLTDWLNNIYYSQEYVGGISGFFKSDSWNGFKIGYTLESENEYTHIYSSEFHTPSCRPTLSISYSYTPPDYLENGMVVEILNASTAKRMTVHNESPANGTNIYQAAGNGSLSQAFKFLYDEDSQSFRIQSLRTIAASVSVLDFHYNSTTDSSFNDYKDANVRLYESSSSRDANQEWLILPNGSDSYSQTYRIVSRADPNLALTCYGSGDGSATGTTSTSMGNIFVSEYTGASNQRWWILTDGNFLLTGLNIKTTTRNNFECPEGAHRYTFTCPVSNYGDSVSWSSSNPYVATVSNGRVTCVKAGEATITATVTHADGTVTPYSKTIYTTLADGVYYFHNVETNARLEYFDSTCINPNDCLIARNRGSNQDEPDANQRYAMFKIKHLGEGVYTIRSMLKSDMGLRFAGTNPGLFSNIISADDDSVSETEKWEIHSSENGYYIRNAKITRKTITAPGLEQEATTADYDATNMAQYWMILPITTAYHGVNIRSVVDHLPVGDSFQLTASMYSSYINKNRQTGFTWSVTNGTGSAVIDSNTGVLTGVSVGTVTVTVRYNPGSVQDCIDEYTIYITPTSEGYYRFENKGTSKYMQPDDGGNSHMEQHNFDDDPAQQWQLLHYDESYYYIINKVTGGYLTAPDNNTSGSKVLEASYSASIQDRQLWAVNKISNQTSYKIQSKNQIGGDLVLAVGWGVNWNGVNIEQRTFSADTNYKDEWYLARIRYAFSAGVEFHSGEDVVDANNNWSDCGYDSSYILYPTASDLNYNNLNCDIVYFSSHGERHRLILPEELVYLVDGLKDFEGNTVDISDFSLPNAKLYIYDACRTANIQGEDHRNLCTETVAAGVDCVIGWTDPINSKDARDWQIRFQSKLVIGWNVIEAANYANTFNYQFNDSIKSWRIYGNPCVVINDSTQSNQQSAPELLYTNIKYSRHSKDAIKAILADNFPTFSNADAYVKETYTNVSKTNYVIDYYYLYNGARTDSGYSVIVEDGTITQIRDNTVTQRGVMQSSARSSAPPLTQAIVKAAMSQAVLEVQNINSDYIVAEQTGYMYYDIETGKYYYLVMTTYMTPDNAYGAITTFFEL